MRSSASLLVLLLLSASLSGCMVEDDVVDEGKYIVDESELIELRDLITVVISTVMGSPIALLVGTYLIPIHGGVTQQGLVDTMLILLTKG